MQAPHRSLDGSRIAFDRYNSDHVSFSVISVMNADGSNQTRLTTGEKEDRWPAWDTLSFVSPSARPHQ